MTKEDGSLPDKTSTPGLINNIVHSLFEDVKIYINDKLVSTATKDYHYKSYISSVLTYSDACKTNHLQCQGFYKDGPNHFGAVSGNVGFWQRHNLFRESNDKVKDYKKTPQTFIGRLHHDLMNITTGISENN